MKKFIFLDLDGVLNHEAWFVSEQSRVNHTNDTDSWVGRYFDPNKVTLLNQLTSLTDAKIVFSSSHRHHFETLKELKSAFKVAGIDAEMIGVTPKLYFIAQDNIEYHYSVPRGCEIKAWFELNKGILGNKLTKVPYVILDDDSDMLYWQRNNFVHLDSKFGLTQENVDKAIEILNEANNN
jgi:hypothetical protein|tara:strand:+ start:429 stop:968 length:540 start_codon:yes stop_codon:yes gene_type:complete